jgi:hypothetical protein
MSVNRRGWGPALLATSRMYVVNVPLILEDGPNTLMSVAVSLSGDVYLVGKRRMYSTAHQSKFSVGNQKQTYSTVIEQCSKTFDYNKFALLT